MSDYLKVEQIRLWPQDSDGWHVCPETGKRIYLGDDCTLGDGCKLGDGCTLGDYCTLGDDCTLGYGCTLGDCCKLGEHETSESLNRQFLALYATSAPAHVFTKIITRDRMSPNFDGGTPIEYPVGAVIECKDAVISDRQCAPGLHVFRRGLCHWWYGLGSPHDDLIAISVEVASEDICFAGTPGNDAKLRVRKLKVLS